MLTFGTLLYIRTALHEETTLKTVTRHAFAIAFLVLASSPFLALGKDTPWIDRNGFPEAYGILTSDHMMFPDNIADWPMKIDSSRQLFIDDYLISSLENLRRRFHQPAKHPGNPLMPGQPVAVLYDDQTGKFRMWYDRHYAESDDGLNWIKPNLGPDGNMIIRDPGEVRGFIYNTDLPERNERYKIVFEIRYNERTGEPGGFYLYHSRDGLNWQRRPQRPILQRTYNHMMSHEPESEELARKHVFQWENPDRFQACGVGDTSIFQYDPVLKKYTCSGKFNIYMPPEKFKELGVVRDQKFRLRLRTFMESDDLIHWTPPRFLLFPDKHDEPDCQIYSHIGFPYESMWIGMIRIMHVIPAGFKQVDLQLAYSRDGRHWLRPLHREPFIGLGSEDSWEADYSCFTKYPPTLVKDELWFYYYGSRNGERDKSDRWGPLAIGLARLRRDGFASLDAGPEVGTIKTRPIAFAGKKLFVNADVQNDGWLRAAVLTRDSEPIPSLGLDDSIPLTQNTTKGPMMWKTEKQLDPPGDDHLRLVFQLKNASLYSFWIE
jgi:hypothetical protein